MGQHFPASKLRWTSLEKVNGMELRTRLHSAQPALVGMGVACRDSLFAAVTVSSVRMTEEPKPPKPKPDPWEIPYEEWNEADHELAQLVLNAMDAESKTTHTVINIITYGEFAP